MKYISLTYCPQLEHPLGHWNWKRQMPHQLFTRTLLAATLLALIATPALALTDLDVLDYDALGYVGHGEQLEYQHIFEPATHVDADITIESVLLEVWVIDDWACNRMDDCMNDWFYKPEVASIDLNSVLWTSGQATASIFWGDITAEANLLANEGILDVTVSSEQGDFSVLRSALWTLYNYEGGEGGGAGTNPMPEPSAALVFAIGVLAMRASVRNSRKV